MSLTAWVLTTPLGGTAVGYVVAQTAGVPDPWAAPVGGVISSTAIGAFAYWRMNRQDRELEAERNAGREMNRLLFEKLVPALEAANHSANEVRAGLTAVLDAQRRDATELVRRVEEVLQRRAQR